MPARAARRSRGGTVAGAHPLETGSPGPRRGGRRTRLERQSPSGSGRDRGEARFEGSRRHLKPGPVQVRSGNPQGKVKVSPARRHVPCRRPRLLTRAHEERVDGRLLRQRGHCCPRVELHHRRDPRVYRAGPLGRAPTTVPSARAGSNFASKKGLAHPTGGAALKTRWRIRPDARYTR